MNLSCRYQAVLLLALAGFVSAAVVKEELTLTWERGAPNGQAREMIMMNGQFPGPTFRWDEDDDVEVRSDGLGYHEGNYRQ
ncbi:Laccase 1 [Aspergillus melleus]|uniref:Laccase 1 n=1 Tax=Aspergillus melleus TaxID=138277 RepID=UPI001E8E0E34|nr:Laccase 1 [Aspergillus melleus]KAH8432995.1 Laccase 1 [Aspergillus melleus]